MEDIVAMARAAEKDESLSDGALYGKLADRIENLERNLNGRDKFLVDNDLWAKFVDQLPK